MSKNYRLYGSPLTGKIYIARTSPKNESIMLDKTEVPLHDFFSAIASYIRVHGNENEVTITADEKPILTLKSFPENF